MNIKLSPTQLVILLFFGRHYSLLTYTNTNLNLEANMFSIIVGDILSILLLVPSLLLFKRNNSNNLLDITQNTSTWLAKTFYLIFFIFFTLTTFISLSSFSTFMVTTIFPSVRSSVIIFSMLIFCLYAIINGLDTLAKTASLLLPLTVIGIILIVLTALFNINFDNFKPILDKPILTIFQRAVSITLQNIELVALVYLFTFFKGSKKRVIGGYLGTYTLIHELLIFMCIAVLGEYLYIQQYPAYAIATVARFSIFQRMDALYMGIWVFTGFIKISLYFWLAINALNHLISTKYNKYVYPILFIVLLITCVYRNYFFMLSVGKIIFTIHSILFIVCLIGFPLLLLIIQIFKKKESCL